MRRRQKPVAPDVTVPLRPTLVIMAAGQSTRFGRLKQLEPVGPASEALMDYAIWDARRGGFDRVVLVIRSAIEAQIRQHMEWRWPGLDWRLAHQDRPVPGDPGSARDAPARRRPWGTAHAVLCAEPDVPGPFAVVNADDFYGRGALTAVAEQLTDVEGAGAVVAGYPIGATLSSHGGVSRAILLTDSAGDVIGVREVHDVRRTSLGLTGHDATGNVLLQPEARVSMNLWGFTRDLFPLLDAGFVAFLAAHREDTAAEYPLSTAIDDSVRAGEVRLRMLPVEDDWMGITHPGDLTAVRSRIAALVAGGHYPIGLQVGTRGRRS